MWFPEIQKPPPLLTRPRNHPPPTAMRVLLLCAVHTHARTRAHTHAHTHAHTTHVHYSTPYSRIICTRTPQCLGISSGCHTCTCLPTRTISSGAPRTTLRPKVLWSNHFTIISCAVRSHANVSGRNTITQY